MVVGDNDNTFEEGIGGLVRSGRDVCSKKELIEVVS